MKRVANPRQPDKDKDPHRLGLGRAGAGQHGPVSCKPARIRQTATRRLSGPDARGGLRTGIQLEVEIGRRLGLCSARQAPYL